MKSLTIKTLAVALTLVLSGIPSLAATGSCPVAAGPIALEEIRLGPLHQTNQQAVKHEHPR